MMRRAAFSLLELILALALAVVLISLVCTTVYSYARVTDASRWDIEQSQLARSLLRMIADDLRGIVRAYEADTSGLDAIANLSPPDESDNDESPDDESSDDDDAAGGENGMGNSSAGDLLGAEDSQTSAEQSSLPPGLYGDQYRLEIDVSRLPRFDQYQGAVSGSSADRVSDVKTIAYFMESTATGSAWSGSATSIAARGSMANSGETGLIRRELDRAATLWATANGAQGTLDSQGVLLAPEVVALEFRYFDGTQWTTEWDTDARGSLPLAVEIALQIVRPDEGGQPARNTSVFSAASEDEIKIYRMIVHLPMAEPEQASEGVVESGALESGGDESGGVQP